MAEFKVVAKEIERMCKTYQDKCRTDECPLYLEDLCYAQAMSHIHDYEAGELESVVMRWSKEHPAIEYPAWWEWLENMGIVSKAKSEYSEIFDTVCVGTRMFYPIPADIAQKLGIEPKEG